MKRYFYSVIVVFSFVFQACVAQQLEVNPGFTQKSPSGTVTPKVPNPKLAEGPEAQKPIWKIGYNWEYEWERPGSSGTSTRRIVREESFNGIPCFVMKAGRYEYFYAKNVLGFLGSKRKGKVIVKLDAPFQPLAWPLKLGRQWNNVYKLERVQEESSSNIDRRVVVLKVEEVTVPAGKFKAFKINVNRSYDGELQSEWWYSPQVKWFVKWISYVGRGTRPREYRLKNYTTPESIATGPRQAPITQATKKIEQQPPVAKPVSESNLKAKKSGWKFGYWWKYAWKRPERSGT